MNSHDKKNLDFLMAIDPQTLREWYDSVPKDDIAYALELLRQAQTEGISEVLDAEITITPEVRNLLTKFTLKGEPN